MARPLSDIPSSTPNTPDLESCSGQRLTISGTRKRSRESGLGIIDDIDGHPSKHAKYTEDCYKTRRVNPDRLALRLDPELVAEMDVLIVPGAKMPTFTVRKDFQVRYNVDRRHIYDYFHSRGLRVAKEDKHNNLMSTLSSNARRQPTETELPKEFHVQELGANDSDHSKKYSRDAPPEPPEPCVRSAKRLASARISTGIERRRIDSRSQISNRPSRKLSFTGVLSPFHAKDDDNQRRSRDSDSPLPDFTFPEEFPDTPLLDDDLMSDSPSEDLLELQYPDPWYDFSIDLPLNRGELDSIMSVDEHRPLTQEERIEFYNLIDKSISPPNGVEECSGTYSAYMKERSRFYFDRLFSKGSQGQSRLYHLNIENRQQETSSEEAGDFREWLSNPAGNFVRTVAQLQAEDSKQPAVPNQLRYPLQASGNLQRPNIKSNASNIASPVSDINENGFDKRIASSPSRRLNTPSTFMRSVLHFEPTAFVPAATVYHSSNKLMDDNGAKRSDASQSKLIPLHHGSPGFLSPHGPPNRLRTVSAGSAI